MRYVSPALVLMAALILQAPAVYATPMTFVANLSPANENSSHRFNGHGIRVGRAGPDGPNDTDQRDVQRPDDASHGGAHPLLPAFSVFPYECRGRHHRSRVSWVPCSPQCPSAWGDRRRLPLRRPEPPRRGHLQPSLCRDVSRRYPSGRGCTGIGDRERRDLSEHPHDDVPDRRDSRIPGRGTGAGEPGPSRFGVARFQLDPATPGLEKGRVYALLARATPAKSRI